MTQTAVCHPYLIAVTGTPLPALTYLGEYGLQAGQRVIVPIGKREQVGLILQDNPPVQGGFTLKSILSVLDETPLWRAEELALLDWCSRYYHANWGRVLETALPSALRTVAKTTNAPKRAASPKSLSRTAVSIPQLLTLNAQQAQVVQTIQQETGFRVSLLEGVTGSGKTEVYAHLTADCLAQGQQVLLLVPEIGLTPQMQSRLTQTLGQEPLTLHSGMSDGQRAKVWQFLKTGSSALVIGTRSAIFAPMPKLGLIIVDEEHDTSYKQQDGIRYHARDVAVMRGHYQHCPVLLASATPSFESLNNAQQGKYQALYLPARANNRSLPILEGIDLRQQVLTAGLSPPLIRLIGETLDAGDQVLLFLNRRGYAPVLMCHDCGHTLDCPACELPYTFHRTAPNLRCHHCGKVTYPPKLCPKCGAQHWHLVGQGTQQLEEALTGLFPQTPVLRIDKDSTQGKDKLSTLLADIRSGNAKLILGTQMLAKGHDFAGIGLVGIIDVDGALFARDFRALERLAQLVTQVAGRTGRGDKAGRVVLQTHHPEHLFVQALLTQTYPQIAKDLLAERAQAHLPPFGFSAWVMAEGKDLAKVQIQLSQMRDAVLSLAVSCAGPIPALMHRRQYHFRELLWLQADTRAGLHQAITHLLDHLNQPHVRLSSVKVIIDIDPQDMP